jgi:hypothetical protein
MRWCRLYTETPSDPKLRRIAHQAGATVANTLAVWTSILCHAAANEGEAWGTLAGWDDLDCAINLGIDLTVVRAIRREMEQRITLDNRILKWDARQSKNDHSAERMRQWRAKRSKQNQDVGPDVTSHSVTVTQSDGKKRREEKRELDTSVSNKARAVRSPVVVDVPEWLPAADWDEWVAHRRALNAKAWTPAAATGCVRKLAEYREQGHDPGAVIRHSIAAGYRGLFPPSGTRPPGGQPASRMQWLIDDFMGEKP